MISPDQVMFFEDERLNDLFVRLIKSYRKYPGLASPLHWSAEHEGNWLDYRAKDMLLRIPYRVYIEEEERLYQDEERIMNACLFTRNNSGFVRERYFRELAVCDVLPKWAYPFLFLSLSDYVPNIYRLIYKEGAHHIPELCNVATSNPDQFRISVSRAISYASENGTTYASTLSYRVLSKIAESNGQSIRSFH